MPFVTNDASSKWEGEGALAGRHAEATVVGGGGGAGSIPLARNWPNTRILDQVRAREDDARSDSEEWRTVRFRETVHRAAKGQMVDERLLLDSCSGVRFGALGQFIRVASRHRCSLPDLAVGFQFGFRDPSFRIHRSVVLPRITRRTTSESRRSSALLGPTIRRSSCAAPWHESLPFVSFFSASFW